jgi:geranylgeranyl transferase type-2 subunit alpha
VFSRRGDAAITTSESLLLTAQFLRVNPDVTSVWNMRRDALVRATGGIDVVVELGLSADCIKKNSKSYGAWHHRAWLIARGGVDLTSELDLCAMFLRLDARNFHCWNYRRLVASEIGEAEDAAEFAFSTKKITENFSNYSAFHHRSIYIRRIGISAKDCIADEFALTESAIYTEPDDQSAWWYRQFLYSWVESEVDDECYTTLLHSQMTVLKGLLELEPDSKWTIVELVSLLIKLIKLVPA